MNIIFLLRPWPVYGGGETVTITLANEFIKRGHIVHILYTRYEANKRIPYINPKIISNLVPNISADEHHEFSKNDIINANIFLKNYVHNNNINIVIDQWWPPKTLKGIKSQCKVIYCLHMCLFKPYMYENLNWEGKNILFKLIGKKIYNRLKMEQACQRVEQYLPYVDKYIFLANSFRNDYIKFRNTDKYNKILDYCNNPLPYTDLIKKEEIGQKENIVLFVGRMYDDHKKVTKILQIWQKVVYSNLFNDWELILIGDGPDKKKFEKYAQDLYLKNYKFVGYQQPQTYYRKAKIFLMTSTYEGWPMTLIESQQNAVVPIVRNTFSSVYDIIKNNENGIITKANEDIQNYANILMQLMHKEVQLKSMAEKGLISCQQFSIEKIANKWESIFHELFDKQNIK